MERIFDLARGMGPMTFRDRHAPESDDTLYELSALACDVSWVFDPSTRRFVHLGGQPERLLGPRVDLRAPDVLAQRIHPEDLDALRDGVSRGTFDGVTRVAREDGSVRWLELRFRERSSLLYGIANDVTDQRAVDRTLELLQEATARATGETWVRELVRCLSAALGMETVFVGELVGSDRVRTVACWSGDAFLADPVEYGLAGTPCERVARGAIELVPSALGARYPASATFAGRHVESYLGVAVSGRGGSPLGVLVGLHGEPVVGPEPRMTGLLRLLAMHAGAELERLRAEAELRLSEARLRAALDARDEAVWLGGFDGRGQWVSSRFAQLLGLGRSELLGRPLADFLCEGSAFLADLERRRGGSIAPAVWTVRARARSDGEAPLRATTTTLCDPNGQPNGVVATLSRLDAQPTGRSDGSR